MEELLNKLIELLNEHEKIAPSRLQRKYYSESGHIMYIDEEGEDVDDYRTDYEIISKEYGFIKRLVDNDKIDFSREGEYCIKSIEEFDGLLRDNEDGLIMILAISSSPIDDLISYLK